MWHLQEINKQEWAEHWGRIKRSNLLQSWQYGEAKRGRFLSHYNYLIIDDNGLPLGIIQILVHGFFGLGGVARINRGPLFFSASEFNEDKIMNSFEAIRSLAVKKNWLYIRFAPEVLAANHAEEIFLRLGLKKIDNATPYGSMLIDLNREEDEIFMSLKGKWRNLLRKSMNCDVSVAKMTSEDNIDYLITAYNKHQEDKEFVGIPEKILRNMAKQIEPDWSFQIWGAFTKENNETPIASIVSVRHGDTCTYLVGISDDVGRRLNASYILLWNAILNAKESGCQYFDVGGVNSDTVKGIAHFKKGMGGQLYNLAGEWHWFIGIAEKIYNLFHRGTRKH